MLEPFEYLPKMTDKELLKYTRNLEKKNAKRFNGYCLFLGVAGLILLLVLVLGK